MPKSVWGNYYWLQLAGFSDTQLDMYCNVSKTLHTPPMMTTNFKSKRECRSHIIEHPRRTPVVDFQRGTFVARSATLSVSQVLCLSHLQMAYFLLKRKCPCLEYTYRKKYLYPESAKMPLSAFCLSPVLFLSGKNKQWDII